MNYCIPAGPLGPAKEVANLVATHAQDSFLRSRGSLHTYTQLLPAHHHAVEQRDAHVAASSQCSSVLPTLSPSPSSRKRSDQHMRNGKNCTCRDASPRGHPHAHICLADDTPQARVTQESDQGHRTKHSERLRPCVQTAVGCNPGGKFQLSLGAYGPMADSPAGPSASPESAISSSFDALSQEPPAALALVRAVSRIAAVSIASAR